MANIVEPIDADLTAQLVHAGGGNARIEVQLPDGRVIIVPCEIEERELTPVAAQLPELPTEEVPPPEEIPPPEADAELDAALAKEKAAHAAADAEQEETKDGDADLTPAGD